jgi:hypothetical protein
MMDEELRLASLHISTHWSSRSHCVISLKQPRTAPTLRLQPAIGGEKIGGTATNRQIRAAMKKSYGPLPFLFLTD